METIVIQARLTKSLVKQIKTFANKWTKGNKSEVIRTIIESFCLLESEEQAKFLAKAKSVTPLS